MKTHPARAIGVIDTGAIVSDGKVERGIGRAEADADSARVTVPGGIVYGFLGDTVEMIRDNLMTDPNGSIALDSAIRFETAIDAERKFLKCRDQSLFFEQHGKESACQLPRLIDGRIYQSGNASGAVGFGMVAALQGVGKIVAVKEDPDEKLA